MYALEPAQRERPRIDRRQSHGKPYAFERGTAFERGVIDIVDGVGQDDAFERGAAVKHAV